ncbi:hypothetical protein BYT27DRAFT_7213852 [Phlegmacium glaucopus]|nr:hypothetical protein BYT27DRAFT_7213852 [Phlegmacium glaucopus]
MSQEGYDEAIEKLKERQKLIDYHKAQIKCWIAYQYTKDQDMDPVDSGAKNPYQILLHQLTDFGNTRPCCKTARNIWCKSHNQLINDTIKNKLKVPHTQQAALRDKVAKELFERLPQVEQDQ